VLLSLPRRARAFQQSPALQKYVQPLPDIGGVGGIPVAIADPDPAPVTGVDHYTIRLAQLTDQLHPGLSGPTTLWGYVPTLGLGVGEAVVPRHLGGIIIAEKDVPIQITFRNELPPVHPLPVDTTIPGAEGAVNRATVHLHGGFVPWISDGGPLAWFTPGNTTSAPPANATHGPSFIQNTVLNPDAGPGEAEYYYPNGQSARLLWYHDHAIGTTRLNAQAGLATAYIIRDDFERGLRASGLPDFIENGGREIPLIIQDKVFRGTGALGYPDTYEHDRFESDPPDAVQPIPSVVPEFFGDTMLVDGVAYPEVEVEARRYRLRVLNACSARFVNLQLYLDDGSADGVTLDAQLRPTNTSAPSSVLQIGTEGGFLPHPVIVPMNRPFDPVTLGGSLILAPAERADLVIDFSGLAGESVIVYNDAPAPFPGGDPINDYFPGALDNPTITQPGFGPDTRQLIRFRVKAKTSDDPVLAIGPGTDLRPGNATLLVEPETFHLPPHAHVRKLTLNESFDPFGRLIQLLGVEHSDRSVPLPFEAQATETPAAGSTEVWEIANLTGDTHPIHFHLVNAQIVSRQPFKLVGPHQSIVAHSPRRPPDPDEAGWKETVRMHPGEITTVIMKFDLPQDLPFAVPTSPRTGGNEYVWHCHILEHEEHDMMRPLVVV